MVTFYLKRSRNNLFVCLFVCLFGVYRPTQAFFTHMETSNRNERKGQNLLYSTLSKAAIWLCKSGGNTLLHVYCVRCGQAHCRAKVGYIHTILG